MNRISTNESFPRNIILSIDGDESNYQLNLSSFRNYFQDALGSGKAPQDAVEDATEKLRRLVEKRKQIFIPKPGVKRDTPLKREIEERVEKEKPLSVKKLEEEGDIFKRKTKSNRKEKILKQISDSTGVVDDGLNELYSLFLGKRKNFPTENIAIKKTIEQYNSKKAPEEKKVYTDEEIARFIPLVSQLDRSDSRSNIVVFKNYLKRGFSLQESIERVKYLISSKNYMRENGIEINPANVKMFLESDEDFGTIARQIIERAQEGKLGLDVNKLYRKENEKEFVIYNGERIGLARLVQYLYNEETLKKKKFIFERLQDYIYDYGLTIDDAIAKVNKTIRFFKFKSTLTTMFPEDPNAAIMIFEEHYLDDDMSFEDALEETKKEIYPSN